MLTKLRSHLTYGNAMATVAVFVALGGTAYSVATGSINSREIRNNTIRSKDVRNNSIRGKDVRNDRLDGDDIRESSLATVPDAALLDGFAPDAFLQTGANAGGDLDGTYPNPSIAPNAVTSDKVADASLRVSDLSVHTINGLGGSSVTLSIPAHTCINNDFAVTGIEPGDRVLMFLKNLEPDTQVQNQVVLGPQFATMADRLPFRACNIGAAALTNETIPLDVIVIR